MSFRPDRFSLTFFSRAVALKGCVWFGSVLRSAIRPSAVGDTATKWFHEELGEPWEVVAHYLGDKLTTVLNHYVRAGEDALRDSVSKLSDR